MARPTCANGSAWGPHGCGPCAGCLLEAEQLAGDPVRERRVVSMHERCLAYARKFPQWPDSWPYVSPSGRWIYGTWVIGGLFKNLTRYPGAYPRTLVDRVRALFPEVPSARLLHLFSGSLPKGAWTRVDIRDQAPAGKSGFVRPEIVGSVYDLPHLLATRRKNRVFDLVMADPSYPGKGVELYETAEIDTARAFRSIAAAVRPGTHVAWLSTSLPLYRKDQWRRYGAISIERSTGQAYRKVALFERLPFVAGAPPKLEAD